jgi:hypothetical protein
MVLRVKYKTFTLDFEMEKNKKKCSKIENGGGIQYGGENIFF